MKTTLDHAQEAMRRMAAEVRPAPTMPETVRHRVRRRQARTVGVAMAVAAGVIVAATFGLATLRTPAPEPPRPADVEHTWSELPVGWTRLVAPPEPTEGATFVWAGDRLLAVGGRPHGLGSATVKGFALGPNTTAWAAIPDAPLPVDDGEGIWTGTEAIFLGAGDSRWEAEAYDPSTSSWRVLADPPGDRRDGAMTVWTGDELIVWGGGSRIGPPDRTGFAWDPVTDTWHPIADSPIGLNQGNAVWAWPRMIVFGSELDESNAATTATAIGAEYDPRNDTWQQLPPSGLSPQADSIAAVGRTVVAWDYLARSQTGMFPIGAAPASWQPGVDMPLRPAECYPDSAAVENDSSGEVFAWFCGQAAVYDRSRSMWDPVTGEPTEGFRTDAPSFSAADVLGAGRLVLLPPAWDHEWALWAYRPPSNAPTAAEVAPPTFEPANGWNTISTTTNPNVLDRDSAPFAWASNVPFAERDLAGYVADGSLTAAVFPARSAKALPEDGVLMTALTYPYREGTSPNVNFPARELPLQISDADVRTNWEGQVASNVPEYLLLATVDGRWVEVRIYFGTLDPSPSTLETAQEELNRLVLPPRP